MPRIKAKTCNVSGFGLNLVNWCLLATNVVGVLTIITQVSIARCYYVKRTQIAYSPISLQRQTLEEINYSPWPKCINHSFEQHISQKAEILDNYISTFVFFCISLYSIDFI